MLPEVISMDPPNAKEIDDAISARRETDGTWIVDVMIPDVPSMIQSGSENDRIARSRGMTIYEGSSAKKPMLPHDVTRNLSLSPDRDGPAIHVVIRLSRDLQPSIHGIRRISHRTAARLDYAEGDRALADPDHPNHAMLRELWHLASLLHADRSASTGAKFDVVGRTYTNEEGREIGLDEAFAHRSNMIVMEIMILANSALAEMVRSNGVPMLFRNHRLRGFDRGDRSSAAAELAVREGIGRRSATAMIKSLQHLVDQADLGTTCVGHYGLDVPAYGWFTSPLRRYADVVNLRVILGDADEPDLERLASDLTAIHRSQKDASAEHHGRTSRRLLLKLLRRGDHHALKASDVHTIVRALIENPGSDRMAAMRHIEMRMRGNDLSGRDIAALVDNADEIVGEDGRRSIVEWLEDDPARGILLNDFREGRPPRTQQDSRIPVEDHKGILLGLAGRRKATVEFSNTRTGPPHNPIFTVTAAWKGPEGRTSARAEERTLRAGEQHASRKLLSMLQDAASEASTNAKTRSDGTPKHPKTELLEIVQSTPGAKAEFGKVMQGGTQHDPSFEAPVVVTIRGATIQATGSGRTKKEAERRACEAALHSIRGGPQPSEGE